MASNRTKRMILMAQLAKNSENESSDDESLHDPYSSSDSIADPDYMPSEEEYISDIGQNNSENNNNVNVDAIVVNETTNCARSPEILNLGSNLREQTSSSESDEPVVRELGWSNPQGNHFNFDNDYIEGEGIRPECAAALAEGNPFDFFSAFIDRQVIDLMVDQTNMYATQVICSGDDIPQSSRLHKWSPTSAEEMMHFLGLVGYMGLVKMPTIRHYWSRKRLFRSDIVSSVMSRNRFELLLHLWHFSDNESCPPGDRIFKVQPLVDILVSKFQYIFTPGNTFCIYESLVPFRGRLIFKQYIPLKTHKYGVKIFKLCSGEGYTWNMKIYCGKEQDAGASVPTNVVMTLADQLLDHGRTAITDNYYTSLDLADKLLDRKTHLLGTLRANRRGNPKEVTQKKLKRGEIVAKENERGICIMKWKDKRDVLLLSTKHIDEMEEIQVRGEAKLKPKAILAYNKGKSSIDLSDQMASYNSALRKTIKWYRKVAIEAIFGTCMVNAHFLYKKINGSSISITEFRESIYEEMMFWKLKENKENHVGTRQKRKSEHKLDKKEGPAHKKRKYCKGCYEKKVKGEISKNTVKKVNTYCVDCENEPHYIVYNVSI